MTPGEGDPGGPAVTADSRTGGAPAGAALTGSARAEPSTPAPGEARIPDRWVVTGMSGAGKRTALDALRRAGFGAVHDLPLDMLAAWSARDLATPEAAVVHVAGEAEMDSLSLPLPSGVRVLFLDARDEVLVRRLADSTVPHPCAAAGAGMAAVTAERMLLRRLRGIADSVVDTSDLDVTAAAARVLEVVGAGPDGAGAPFVCAIASFGFKYGLPLDAEWVVDVRVLSNPFWVPELRPLTGLDSPVRDHVLGDPASEDLISRLAALLAWNATEAERRGRRRAQVAVGCTGGRHRSVVVAEELAARLRAGGIAVEVRHRDAGRPDPRG